MAAAPPLPPLPHAPLHSAACAPSPSSTTQQVKGDLLGGSEGLAGALRGAGVERVTHLFHCAYLMKGDPKEECEARAS